MDEIELRQSLQELAGHPEIDEDRASRLHDLADALGDEAAEEAWSRVDLRAVFVSREPGVSQPAERPALLRYLDLFRTGLIFAPIAVTWFAISRASNAYRDLVRSDSRAAETPFLILWQNGFEGNLDSWLTLEWVGLIIASLIVLVIGLTIYVSHKTERLDDRTTARRSQLERRVDAAVADAMVYLAERRRADPERIEEVLGSSTRALADAAVAARDAVADSRAAIASLASVPGELADTIRGLEVVVARTADATESQTDRLVSATDQIVAAAREQADHAQANLTSYQTVVAKVEEAAKHLKSGSTRLDDVAGRVGSVSGQMADALESATAMSQRQQRVLDYFADVVETEKQRAASLSGSVDEISVDFARTVSELKELATAMNATFAHMLNVEQEFPVFISSLRQESQRLVDAQSDVANRLDTIVAMLHVEAHQLVEQSGVDDAPVSFGSDCCSEDGE